MKKYAFLLGVFICSGLLISGTIDLDNLFDYENQTVPVYITKDNTTTNTITDEGATLGRVLFYDKNLSSNNLVSCSSCHQQEFAFSDTSFQSEGVNDLTGRRSMRLINARFGDETSFFWNERAATLEEQTTMPIQDHAEMGYSGTSGDEDINDLIDKLHALDYYNDLFFAAFGDTTITEERMQFGLAQFIRSIQSFDSKFDEGMAVAPNIGAPFPNFTADENAGKNLFLAPPQFDPTGSRIAGGLGCAGCHRGPEFDIDPNSLSNGVVYQIGSTTILDTGIHRAPTLRDLVNPQGLLNGNLMHNAEFSSIQEALQHYNVLPTFANPAITQSIDPRLRPGGNAQQLNMTQAEMNQVEAFLLTLTGSDVYTNERWSDPFGPNGAISVIGGALATQNKLKLDQLTFYPNPTSDFLNIRGELNGSTLYLYSINGKLVQQDKLSGTDVQIQISQLPSGTYLAKVIDQDGNVIHRKIVKR